jgi:hypothetical protein
MTLAARRFKSPSRRRSSSQALVVPCEAGLGEDHAALEDLAPGTVHQRERHDVQHLVGDHEAADALGQPVDPLEAPDVLRVARRDQLALALAQVGADLEEPVTLGCRALRLEHAEQVRGQHARAGSQLEDLGARGLHHLARLHGQALGEHVRDLGRRDEVALGPELARPGGVVTEPRRIKRQLHETRERDPVALGHDRVRDALGQRLGVRGRFRGRRRQDRVGEGGHRRALQFVFVINGL